SCSRRSSDGGRGAVPTSPPLPRASERPLSRVSSRGRARGRVAGRTAVDSPFQEDAHVWTGRSGADADPAHRAGAVRWIEDSRSRSLAGAGDPRVQEGRGGAGRSRRAQGGGGAPEGLQGVARAGREGRE